MSSYGLGHALNTMRAGPLKVRVTTSSRSDFRSIVVGLVIDLLPVLQLLDDRVQRVEARRPDLAIVLDPGRLFLEPAQTEPAGPHPTDLLRGDEARAFQDADMLLHAREGHVEFVRKLRDRGVRTSELLQDAASCGVRERAERRIEVSMLSHLVQC